MDIELKDGKKVKVMVLKNKDIYEYFINGEKVGVLDPNKMYDNILILQNTLENELSDQIRDQVNALDREEIEDEAKENTKIKEYAEEIGIERIKNIHVIDLKEKEKGRGKEEIRKENAKKIDAEEHGKKQTENITTTKDINVKQEISLSERADDMHDLRKWLGGKIPDDFTKIAVIDSDDMSEFKDKNGNSYNKNSTRYSMCLVNEKTKEVEPLQKYIPELKQRAAAGNNPIEQKYQVDKSGEVEKDAVLSEYELGDKIIQIDNKQMGRVELNIGKEEHGGNETMGVQMRDSNSTFATSKETRSVMGEYESNGEYTVDRNLEEVKEKHEKVDCDEKLTSKDIDGDEQTKSHNHISEEDLDRYATEILKNDEISAVYNRKDVISKLKENIRNGGEDKELDGETLTEVTEKQMEEDAQKEHPTLQGTDI